MDSNPTRSQIDKLYAEKLDQKLLETPFPDFSSIETENYIVEQKLLKRGKPFLKQHLTLALEQRGISVTKKAIKQDLKALILPIIQKNTLQI